MKRHQRSLISLIRRKCNSPVSGVEIGVFKGSTSAILLACFPTCRFLFVDPWRAWPQDSVYYQSRLMLPNQPESMHMEKYTKEQWETIRTEAYQTINKVGGHFRILQGTSEFAASFVGDEKFDFVFLDGNHAEVAKDIDLWLPRTVRMMCGHDYGNSADRRNRWRIKEIVDERFGAENVMVRPGGIWGVKIK